METPARKTVSVVVPCYNEEEVIERTYARLRSALEAAALDFDLIFVDDGSRDATWRLLEGLRRNDPRVKLLRFARNFGHQRAVTAGLDYARGDAVVLIDADLQDPPEVIAEMVNRWRAGADVVYGQRRSREGESGFKLLTARVFYRLINSLSDVTLPVDTGDFRLMDRRVVDALRQMPENDRYIRGMVSWVGFRQEAVLYDRARREAGESKYPLFKMLRFATDGILSFSLVPLKLATWLGLASAGIAMLGIIYALVMKILGLNVEGWTLLFMAMAFLGGIQLLCLGIIGEYVGRTYFQSKQRPLYLVRDAIGFEPTSAVTL
jgi:dolichol-phosphate mannosyltransferase